MPKSRKRRTKSGKRRSNSSKPRTDHSSRMDADELTRNLAVLRATDDAERRGDAKEALDLMEEHPGGVAFWRPGRARMLLQLALSGRCCPHVRRPAGDDPPSRSRPPTRRVPGQDHQAPRPCSCRDREITERTSTPAVPAMSSRCGRDRGPTERPGQHAARRQRWPPVRHLRNSSIASFAFGAFPREVTPVGNASPDVSHIGALRRFRASASPAATRSPRVGERNQCA
jgi:hypothetical protein